MDSLLSSTCLKPSYSLRKQLFWSFGSSAFATIGFVVALACVASKLAGDRVRDHSVRMMRKQVVRNLHSSTRFAADRFSRYLEDLEGTTQLLVELVQERIVGYPDGEGWEDDAFVPFFDMDSQRNRYPLKSPPIPMDWNISENINRNNSHEHLQERAADAAWLDEYSGLSSIGASYFMQGACDPLARPDSQKYYENCTEANNDPTTGGVVRPTRISKWLHEKASDLGVLMKAIHESQPNAEVLRISFQNMGAGATVVYPGGSSVVGNGLLGPYVSEGCDWMEENINPYTGEPFGTKVEISRCHPKGTLVPPREYNPLEQSWYRECALRPSKVGFMGPFFPVDGTHAGGFHLFARGAFDQITGHFIGCVSTVVRSPDIDDDLKQSRLHEASELAIVRLQNDFVVADTLDSYYYFSRPNDDNGEAVQITETGMIDAKRYAELKQSLGSFNSSFDWTPTQVQQGAPEKLQTVYPIPSPPETYDASYRPEMLVLHTVSDDIFLNHTALFISSIEANVAHLIIASVAIGFSGLVVVLLVIFCVSRELTRPLVWIESVAWRIVNHADKRATEVLKAGDSVEIEELSSIMTRLTPRTEITDLVTAFRMMIKGFSGTGAATVEESKIFEVPNGLERTRDFQQLGVPSKRNSFMSSQEFDLSSEFFAPGFVPDSRNTRSLGQRARAKSNLGPNVLMMRPNASNGMDAANAAADKQPRVLRSSLFWWILALIVSTLLLTNIIICLFTSFNIIVTNVPSWVATAENASVALEMKALELITSLKAKLAETVVQAAVKDLYVMTRVAGWLIFGGVATGSFNRVDSAENECKSYPPDRTCPFFSSDRHVCLCEWDDPVALAAGFECTVPEKGSYTRPLQTRFFASQARDADPSTGRRDKARSFPRHDYSANTTLWWERSDALPGAHEGSNASGSETTYSTLRAVSALDVVEMPLYNYLSHLGRPKINYGTWQAFELEGLYTGFGRCTYLFATLPHFESSEQNGAEEIAPELCPLGKHGYDPRCRDWYNSGKLNYLSAGRPLHITAPYAYYPPEIGVGTSATSPIANPQTGEYVGQTIFDFQPDRIRDSLHRSKESISILVTPEKDQTGGDTVVGPNKSSSAWKSSSVMDLLFLFGEDGSPDREYFESTVLKAMKNGSSDISHFRRKKEDGFTTETLTMAYEPVYVRSLLPVDPSDFSRGVNASKLLVYSVGMAYTLDSLSAPFDLVEDTVYSDLETIGIIYISLVVICSLLFTFFTFRIAVFVTRPVITLLVFVQNINRGEFDDDVPPLSDGGCREVHKVHGTFAKLYRIVKISNSAFFSGNLKSAYRFVSDALALFRKVKDEKAIGIACNNLGNALLASYAQNVSIEGSSRAGIHESSTVGEALERYDEAIQIGQRSFEKASHEELKADFAQQLANRLFNRAMFLLKIQDDISSPENAREAAYRDIEMTRQLDADCRDFWLERRLLLNNSSSYYSRLIRRLNGLVDFYEDNRLREIWNARELVEEADRILFECWNDRSAPIFGAMTPIGRLQQLEAVVIRLELCLNNTAEACRLATRGLVEDEFMIEPLFKSSATALLKLINSEERVPWSSETTSTLRTDIRSMMHSSRNVLGLDFGICLLFSVEISERWEGDPLLAKLHSSCLKLYDSDVRVGDYVGLAANTTQGDLTVELGRKHENRDKQRQMLDRATSSTSSLTTQNPSAVQMSLSLSMQLAYAVQMLTAARVCKEIDTFLLHITDGASWDSEVVSSTISIIRSLNQERSTTIHVIIIGLDIQSASVLEQCMQMSNITRASFYVEATCDNIDSVFDGVAAAITASADTSASIEGITMEKF